MAFQTDKPDLLELRQIHTLDSDPITHWIKELGLTVSTQVLVQLKDPGTQINSVSPSGIHRAVLQSVTWEQQKGTNESFGDPAKNGTYTLTMVGSRVGWRGGQEGPSDPGEQLVFLAIQWHSIWSYSHYCLLGRGPHVG